MPLFQSSHVGLTTVVRPKSGNPGYLLGLPVLSGVLKSKDILSLVNGVTTTTTVTAIAQDTRGLTLLPKTTAGLCSTSSADPVHSVLFGHDSKFSCYLSLTQAQLGSLCTTGLSSYFGNVSTSLGIWGNSDFQNVNQWITVEQSTPTFAGVRHSNNNSSSMHSHTSHPHCLQTHGLNSFVVPCPWCFVCACPC